MARMDKLLALTTLLEVADSGGFAKAARRLGVATSSVMRLMDSLEASLGAALLTRTPRRVSLTDAGAAYVEQVSRLLDELNEADESVLDRGAAPAGALRITVPSAYCRAVLGPHLAAFVRDHPRVALDVLVADHFVDLALERIDVAVRIGAPARDPNLIVRTLQENPRWLVASADYLAREGRPATPADLADHECVRISYTGGYRARQAWTFASAASSDESGEIVNVRGRLVTNNVDMLHEAVRAGQGVALLPAWLVKDEVANAKLERLFAGYRITAQGGDAVVYAAWLPNRRHSSKVRALLAFLQTRLA
jgi:DNA-binding transcriptional LysR family regulator